MKKNLILALAMVAPAFAGEPVAPITVVQPAPVAAPSVWAGEVGPSYTLATKDLVDGIDGIDMAGIDITGVYNINDNWAITLRGSWAYGENGDDIWYFTDNQECLLDDIDGETWSLMPGVRYRDELCENWNWYVGVNMGVTHMELKVGPENPDATGFSYSVEAGVQYEINNDWYAYGAVYGAGSTADPAGVDDQFGVGIRAGVGFEF